MKIVRNNCYGGFGLSEKALKMLEEMTGISDADYWEEERTDENLVKVVESLGKEASDNCANLIVVEVPDNVDWDINEYDGWEMVEEKHRSW